VLNERDIKRLAIVCDDDFAFENLLDEIIQVLSIDISYKAQWLLLSYSGDPDLLFLYPDRPLNS